MTEGYAKFVDRECFDGLADAFDWDDKHFAANGPVCCPFCGLSVTISSRIDRISASNQRKIPRNWIRKPAISNNHPKILNDLSM